MRRLLRLALVVCCASAVVAAAAVAVIGLTGTLLSSATTSSAAPLPSLDASVLTGTTVYADDGRTVLATFSGPEIRRPVTLPQISPTLVKAVLDTEDERFYLHGGFDVPSTMRALVSDSSGSGLQGGSTITQQLVKQIYLSSARKLSRKVKEAVLAARINKQYTKDQILTAYLNIIYLGDSAYGVEAAANVYFGENASKLDLPQSALLAGLIQDPTGYDPVSEPEAARSRRAKVLARMVHYGDITQAEADAANAVPLPAPHAASTETITVTNPIYDDYVSEVFDELVGPNSPLGGTTQKQREQDLDENGLKIITGLDTRIQAATSADVPKETPGYLTSSSGCSDKTIGCGYQQGAVVLDATTGGVRAMVGGEGERSTTTPTPGFEVMTQGNRQPGSGFKVFTLIAALEAGYSPYSNVNASAPCAIAFPGGQDGYLSSPAQNDEGDGRVGTANVLTATAQSLNCGYLRIGHEVGLPAIASWAQKLGISTPLPQTEPGVSTPQLVPSMILGGVPVEPVQMAAAYATIANGGTYHAPSFISQIIDPTGNVAFNGVDPGHRVLSSQIAEEATLCLQAVVTQGTGTAAALSDRPVAGKTGTTSGPTDAWFNGFTPQLETTVWMGSPRNTKRLAYSYYGNGIYGGSYPAATWHDIMTDAVAGSPVQGFTPPDPSQLPSAKPFQSRALYEDDKSGYIQGTCAKNSQSTTSCKVPLYDYGAVGNGGYGGYYGGYSGGGSSGGGSSGGGSSYGGHSSGNR